MNIIKNLSQQCLNVEYQARHFLLVDADNIPVLMLDTQAAKQLIQLLEAFIQNNEATDEVQDPATPISNLSCPSSAKNQDSSIHPPDPRHGETSKP